MRVFIGIKFDKNTSQDFENFLKPFKKIPSPIKWVKPENIHLTLKFIGEVTPDNYHKIESAIMDRDFKTGTVNLNFSGCGTFGRDGMINILWLGIDNNPRLDTLYMNIEDALQKTGIEKEKRPFKPHITVGRNKRDFNSSQILDLVNRKADERVSTFRANSFQIFNSELFGGGPVYTIKKEIAIGTA